MSSGEGDSGEKDIVPAPINTLSSQQMRAVISRRSRGASRASGSSASTICIDVTGGENILIGDSAEEFAQACLRVLRDATLRNALVVVGRTLVRQKYGWPAIRREFGAQVRDAMERRRLPAGGYAGAAPLPVSRGR